jgi:hypothetical protein
MIRQRLTAIAEQAAAAADALGDGEAIELDSRQLAELLQDVDGVAARVGGICDRLAGAMDPGQLGAAGGCAGLL